MMEKKKKKKKERRRRRSKLTIGNSVSNLLSNLNWAMPMVYNRKMRQIYAFLSKNYPRSISQNCVNIHCCYNNHVNLH